MRNRSALPVSLVATLTLAFAGLLFPHPVHAQNVSKTAMAGPYSVTFKVLPAETFTGITAEMVRDGGAKPLLVGGNTPPNHHMVAFITKNGAPIENAKVVIQYRQLRPQAGPWNTLPVVRMHVAGKSRATTHYGNNLILIHGEYEARITVNGKGTAHFHFSV